MKTYIFMALTSIALISAACSSQPTNIASTADRPTPTIAAAVLTTNMPAPTANIAIEPAAPSVTPTNDVGAAVTPVTTFAYLWPSYFPDGMRVAPNESRVARADEIGTTGTGFYLVTLNGTGRKLVVGGGATDALPLAGDTRDVTYDNGPAKLTTKGDARQLVFVHDRAKFFVYSSGLSEQELMLVAESMVPIDVGALRDQVRTPVQ